MNRVPKIIHSNYKYSYDKLDIEIKRNIKKNLLINSNYDFKYYSDNDIDNFFKEYFGKDNYVFKSYKLLNPKYKEAIYDLFKYCVLLIHGGIFIDINVQLKINFDSIIDKDTLCILDFPYKNGVSKDNLSFSNWILIFSKNHPYLNIIIQNITNNIINKKIPKCEPSYIECNKQIIPKLTGEDIFSKSINRSISKYGVLYKNIDYKIIANKYFNSNKYAISYNQDKIHNIENDLYL